MVTESSLWSEPVKATHVTHVTKEGRCQRRYMAASLQNQINRHCIEDDASGGRALPLERIPDCFATETFDLALSCL